MATFTAIDVKNVLSTMRDDLREGRLNLPLRFNKTALQEEVASRFGLKPQDLTCDFAFSPKTLERFVILFQQQPPEVTQDDVATALQNFINRRKEPWAFVTKRQASVAVAFAGDAGSGA